MESIPSDTRFENRGSSRLAGNVAIVSGAGTHGGSGVGNGAATAILFAAHGADVALVDQNPDWVESTREIIDSIDGNAISITADVTNPDECEAAVEQTVDAFDRLDILHNNVGGGPRDNVVDVTPAEWHDSFQLNMMSAISMSRFSIPRMKTTGSGAIITTSSLQAYRPSYDYAPYTVFKTGIMGLTRSLAMDYAADNIRANCIMPGPIWTPKVASSRTETDREKRRKSTPVPKEGKPWDVGWAAVFLASDEATWISGTTLPVEGGALLTRGGERSNMF